MRTGPRLVFAALVAGVLTVSGPGAWARSGSSKKPTAPSAPALVTDVARIEPLASPGAAAPTVSLEGVGEYRGIVEVRRAGAGVGAVNEVGLDDYLMGISEVPSSWPAEVLRAQAIAARTYLLWTLSNGAAGSAAALGAQICATESCQVYSGVAKERAANGAAWAAAVRDTTGEALLAGGSPILAKYSACNGGRSVSGGKPYLKVVDDPDDARCPLHRWGLSVSYDDLGRALAVPGTVKSVRATPGDVTVDWTADGGDGAPAGGGGRITVPRTQFRAKVGSAVAPPPDRSRTVPSIMFTLRPDDAGRVATLDGRGFGHAIGMSQWGAYGKALRGLKAGAILAAYYGGIQPVKVPPTKLPATVRVAVDSGRSSSKAQAPKPAAPAAKAPAPAGNPDAVVSAPGPFRILDSKGKVVVPVATGSWRIVPAAKGLQLQPPKGQNGPPGVTVVGIEPAAAVPGQPLTVRFKSNLPAVVSASAQPPGGPETAVLTPRVAGTEEQRVTIPAASTPGIYSVTLTADSGLGRIATMTVAPAVVNLGPPPGARGPSKIDDPLDATVLGGTAQSLVAADRRAAPARASRSAASRTAGSTGPDGPGQPDGAALGLLLASLTGLALWRFRARRPPVPAGVHDLPVEGPEPLA